MSSHPKVSADDFRVGGEKAVLYGSLLALAVIIVALTTISFGLILVIVALSVVWVKIRQGQFVGQCVRVSTKQLPEVYRCAEIAAERLSMELPDVFVMQSPVLNAFATGFLTEKSVVLHSSLIEAMTDTELTSIIGHELGHIKCEHTTWCIITGSAGKFQIPVISQIMEMVFLFWSRKAEYSADRAGLLACRDLQAAISAEAKLAVGKELFKKLNLESLAEQKRDADEDDVARLSELMATHPYMVNRIHAFKEFHRSETYKMLTSEARQSPPSASFPVKFCAECGAQAPSSGKFCSQCGKPLVPSTGGTLS